MHTRVARALLLPWFIALAALCGPPALAQQAQALTGADAEQVRAVVLAQIQALAEDDAERMFETTTPAVRRAIGSPGHFLAMVRGAYPMVYQPDAVTFHKAERVGESGALQPVEITDSQAKRWLAMFVLERQPDASWRISGCVAAESTWTPV